MLKKGADRRSGGFVKFVCPRQRRVQKVIGPDRDLVLGAWRDLSPMMAAGRVAQGCGQAGYGWGNVPRYIVIEIQLPSLGMRG